MVGLSMGRRGVRGVGSAGGVWPLKQKFVEGVGIAVIARIMIKS